MDDPEFLREILGHISSMPGKKVIVHGGGKHATELAGKLQIETHMHLGRRITSLEMLNVAVMVYAGLLNKQLVAQLQGLGCNALGLSGADGNLIRSRKRDPEPFDYGYAGDVEEVNVSLLELLLDSGITPVCCAISHNASGILLNTNADTVAASLAIALSSTYDTRLYYCLDMPGILQDLNDPNSLVKKINSETYRQMLNRGILKDGILPKLQNCFGALEKGVGQVYLGDATILTTSSGTLLEL